MDLLIYLCLIILVSVCVAIPNTSVSQYFVTIVQQVKRFIFTCKIQIICFSEQNINIFVYNFN